MPWYLAYLVSSTVFHSDLYSIRRRRSSISLPIVFRLIIFESNFRSCGLKPFSQSNWFDRFWPFWTILTTREFNRQRLTNTMECQVQSKFRKWPLTSVVRISRISGWILVIYRNKGSLMICRCTQGIRDRPVSGATGSNRSESGSGPVRSGPNPEPIGFGPSQGARTP